MGPGRVTGRALVTAVAEPTDRTLEFRDPSRGRVSRLSSTTASEGLEPRIGGQVKVSAPLRRGIESVKVGSTGSLALEDLMGIGVSIFLIAVGGYFLIRCAHLGERD